MTCPTCGNKKLYETETVKLIEENGKALIIHFVPCRKCPDCGEILIAADTWRKIENAVKLWKENKLKPLDTIINYDNVA